MNRRDFLRRAGLAFGAGAVAPAYTGSALAGMPPQPFDPKSWHSIRQQFSLTQDYIHLATFLLASHPSVVAKAIEQHRKAFDENPADYWHAHYKTIDGEVARAAARYMGGCGEQIALTDSTTMGLAMVYSGLKLASGDEILSTIHDHYSTELSLHLRAERTDANVRHIPLYTEPATVTVDEVAGRLRNEITDRTRVVAVTWVHSSTGVKLPLRAMANVIDAVNENREVEDRILFCVDGVHGFGVENVSIDELGCDFFVAGTHKWIFGPRGTGVIWGRKAAWERTTAVIPSFSDSYDVWLGNMAQADVPLGEHMTPGGFHSFEHRWALPKAFEFHLAVGKARVQERIHELNIRTKLGLGDMRHVKLHTPTSAELSSGLVCFEVDGIHPDDVVKRLHARGIIMSATPYRETYARFAPSIINNEQEIDRALSEIRAMA